MITVRHISSTADFDFDRLYADSYADMAAGSYPWPDDVTDEAQRKQYFTNYVDVNLSDTDNFFGLAVAIDGVDMAFFCSWRNGDVGFVVCCLFAYDNGSKSYFADPDFKAAWRGYLKQESGVSQIGVIMVENSPIAPAVMSAYDISTLEPHGEDCVKGIMADEM